jgi:hypothetical protein
LYPSIDLHCPEDGVSSQGENALWSLESSEKKIKISKDFGMLELQKILPLVDGERSAKPLKFQFRRKLSRVCRVFSKKSSRTLCGTAQESKERENITQVVKPVALC